MNRNKSKHEMRCISQNKSRIHPLAPVVGLDIDGTIADYYGHFKWFAELYLQRDLVLDWSEAKGEFSVALGLEKEEYRAIKLAYRQGGMKRSIPAVDRIAELVFHLRELYGIQVWICTTRPWNRLDNIDPDTQFWLNHNIGRVDGVIYGEEKYQDLIDIVGLDRIIGIVDDLPENVLVADELGISAVLKEGEHNLWFEEPEGIERACTTSEMSTHIERMIRNYKEKNTWKSE